jgi:hypothetical protein
MYSSHVLERDMTLIYKICSLISTAVHEQNLHNPIDRTDTPPLPLAASRQWQTTMQSEPLVWTLFSLRFTLHFVPG